MSKTKVIQEKKLKKIVWDRRTFGVFFLGVGFIMFLVNITSMLTLFQLLPSVDLIGTYWISLISSVFLITYSFYNIYFL